MFSSVLPLCLQHAASLLSPSVWAQVSRLCFVCDVPVCSVRYGVLVSWLLEVKLLTKPFELVIMHQGSGCSGSWVSSIVSYLIHFIWEKKNNRNLHCFLADGLEFYSPKLSFDIVHSWKYLCKMFKRKKKKKTVIFKNVSVIGVICTRNIFTFNNLLGTF